MLTRVDLGMPYPYPLASVFAIWPFAHLPISAYVAFTLVTYLAAIAAFAKFVWSRTHAVSAQVIVWGTFLLFHPMLFLLDRGNIEIVVWLLMAGGVAFAFNGSDKTAAVLFGLAASMKVYPVVLLLIFLTRKQKSALITGIATCLLVTLFAYLIAGPNLLQALRDAKLGQEYMSYHQLAPYLYPIRWNHACFEFLKQAYMVYARKMYHVQEGQVNFRPWIRPYGVVAFCTFWALYLWRIRSMPKLNQVIALVLLALLLPFLSYDYTLTHLGIVFAALLLYALQADRNAVPTMLSGGKGILTGILFGICFSPLTNLAKSYYGGQVKCICLIVLLALVLRFPMHLQTQAREPLSAGEPPTLECVGSAY